MNTEENMKAAGFKKPEAFEQTEEQQRKLEELKLRMEQLVTQANSIKEGQAHKTGMVKELRVGLSCKIEEVTSIINLLERGTGARELALVKTKLQEAKHWAGEALGELGYKLPEEYRDEAK